MRKAILIMLIATVIVVIISTIGIFVYSVNNMTEDLSINEIHELKEDGDVINDEVKIDDPNPPLNKSHLANPRVQFKNASGDEVAAIDHNGVVSGNNLEMDYNATVKQNLTVSETGFFKRIGSGISRVFEGWFEQVNINETTTITANMTLGDEDYFCLGDSGCSDSQIYFNGSSLIIKVN